MIGRRRAPEPVREPERLVHRPLSPVESALVVEACSKSDVVWLRPIEGPRSHPAWHVWHAGAVHVLTAPGEQGLPVLTGVVEVIVPSKETRAQLVGFLTQPELIAPDTPRWAEAAAALAAVRLNALDPLEQERRWAQGADIYALRPVAVTSAVAGTEQAPDVRLPPPGGPGTTLDRTPFHLGGRGRRGRRRSS